MNLLLKTSLFLLMGSPFALAQTDEPVELKTDNLTLSGTLTLPAKTRGPVPVVLLIAGSGPTDRNGNNPVPAGQSGSVKTSTYKLLADSLARLDIATLRYDKRGVGSSRNAGMREQDVTFDTMIGDAVGWLSQLRTDKRFTKVIVMGHSEGSLIGMVAAQRAKADAFISLAGPGDGITSKLKTQLGAQLPPADKEQTFRALDSLKAGFTVNTLPTPYPAVQQLFRKSVQPYMISWMKYDPSEQIKRLTVPVLLIQGGRDIQVSVSDAERLKTAQPSARLLLFDTMSHVLKDVKTNTMQEALTAYNQTDQPLTTGLTSAIARFIQNAGRTE